MSTNAASDFQKQILATLQGVEFHNRYGCAYYMGEPTAEFWKLWETQKNVIKAARFQVEKNEDGWWVTINKKDLNEYFTLEQCIKEAKATQSDREFWADPANWALIPTSKA